MQYKPALNLWDGSSLSLYFVFIHGQSCGPVFPWHFAWWRYMVKRWRRANEKVTDHRIRKPVCEAEVWTEALNGTVKQHSREPSGQYLLCEPDSVSSFSRIHIKVEGKNDCTKFSDFQTNTRARTVTITSNDNNKYKSQMLKNKQY